MTKQRLYLISLDSFGASDLSYARTLPNFKFLLERSALVENVKTVYPSLTYMCHTSISTGMYPNRHGIVHNTKNEPLNLSPDWYWYDKDIQAETFFDVTKKAGYTNASLLWPVTGGNKRIDYNLVEIFPNRSWETQTLVSLLAGSPIFTANLERKFGYLRKGIQQPELDEFLHQSTLYTIEKHQPDFMAVHYVALDAMRHAHGVRSNQAKEAINQMDRHLGEMIEKMQELGIFEETIIAVVGDHYQIDVQTLVHLNTLFHEQGWIKFDDTHTPTEVKVYAKESGGSCYIYNPGEISEDEIYAVLSQQTDIIDSIYSGEEATHRGADSNCAFLVEGKRGFSFSDENHKPLAESIKYNSHLQVAVHGYHPNKLNYNTTFFISGPGINAHAVVEEARLIDEGPTLMHALGLKYTKPTDGNILTELFI